MAAGRFLAIVDVLIAVHHRVLATVMEKDAILVRNAATTAAAKSNQQGGLWLR